MSQDRSWPCRLREIFAHSRCKAFFQHHRNRKIERMKMPNISPYDKVKLRGTPNLIGIAFRLLFNTYVLRNRLLWRFTSLSSSSMETALNIHYRQWQVIPKRDISLHSDTDSVPDEIYCQGFEQTKHSCHNGKSFYNFSVVYIWVITSQVTLQEWNGKTLCWDILLHTRLFYLFDTSTYKIFS